MLNKIVEGAKIALALALVAALVWIAYALLAFSMRWLSAVRSELATAIIAAAAAVLVSFVSVGVSKYLERRDAIERELRLKKVPVYEQLISSTFGLFQQGKPGYPTLEQSEIVRTQTQLVENIILWGSDRVLKQFGEFRVAALQFGKPGAPSALIALESLMLSVRRDLGYKNEKLVTGDVLRLFLNDFTEYQATLRSSKP